MRLLSAPFFWSLSARMLQPEVVQCIWRYVCSQTRARPGANVRSLHWTLVYLPCRCSRSTVRTTCLKQCMCGEEC